MNRSIGIRTRDHILRREPRRGFLAVCLTAFLAALSTWAGGGSENILLLVNAESWISKTVANEYIHLRQIPDINVVQLQGIPSHESLSVDAFRNLILLPAFSAMRARQLEPQIDYIIYSADFPYAVDIRSDIGPRKLPKTVGTQGSLTGLTYLFQGVLAQNLDYVDLNTNWYARQPLRRWADSPWTPDEQDDYARVEAFLEERGAKTADMQKGTLTDTEFHEWEQAQWQIALPTMERLRTEHPHATHLLYNLACALAKLARPQEAIAALSQAVDAGYLDHWHAADDPDLESLRSRADFRDLLQRMKTTRIPMAPPVPFSASVGWTPRGMPAPHYKGARYLLSGMLAYTSGRGNSLAEVQRCLHRSRNADASNPWGTIYFMRNDDIRSTTRDWALSTAAAQIEAAGMRVEILDGILPTKRDDVLGLLTGAASFRWQDSGSTIQPGAICEHLTSFGGVLREGAGQTPLTEFLRHGAAAASGAVQEPFAMQAKFPTAFIQAYYTLGASLAEAYYLSVHAPYQLLLVGDPLCQPWANPPQFSLTVEGLVDGELVGDELRLAAVVSPTSPPIMHLEYFLDGRRVAALPPERAFTVPRSAFPAGVHDLRAVAVQRGGMQSRSSQALAVRLLPEAIPARPVRAVRGEVTYGDLVEFSIEAPDGASVQLYHAGNRIAELEPDAVQARIASAVFGMGPIQVRPVLRLADGSTLPVETVNLSITPADATVMVPAGLGDILPQGLLLHAGESITTVVERTEGSWLEDAGVNPGTSFRLVGWFECEHPDLYQFQFKGNVDLANTISINSRDYPIPEAAGWRSVPVQLAAGAHRVVIQGTAGDVPRLDIRFGAKGTGVLDKATFRYRRP